MICAQVEKAPFPTMIYVGATTLGDTGLSDVRYSRVHAIRSGCATDGLSGVYVIQSTSRILCIVTNTNANGEPTGGAIIDLAVMALLWQFSNAKVFLTCQVVMLHLCSFVQLALYKFTTYFRCCKP